MSRPSVANRLDDENYSLRLTWHATPRNKIAAYVDHAPRKDRNREAAATLAPEAAWHTTYAPMYQAQLVWKSPLTGRLFFDSGIQLQTGKWWISANTFEPGIGGPASPDPNALAAREETTGVRFRGMDGKVGLCNATKAFRSRAVMSYVTGTHATKVGIEFARGSYLVDLAQLNNMKVALRNGVPFQMDLDATQRTLRSRS